MAKKMIWVEEDLVNEILEVSDMCGLGEVARKTFRKMNDEINLSITCMDESVDAFKQTAQVVIDTYDKVVTAERDRIYEAWEKAENVRLDGLNLLNKVKNEIGDTKRQIDELNKSLDGFNTYKIEQFMNTVRTFNMMSESEKTLLSRLFEVGKS